MKGIPEHEEDMRRVLEDQSADVLAGWLRAEDTLKHFGRGELRGAGGQTNTAQGNKDSGKRSSGGNT